jgi:hypothetical protein
MPAFYKKTGTRVRRLSPVSSGEMQSIKLVRNGIGSGMIAQRFRH